MPKITYISFEGNAQTVELESGDTVMKGAIDNGIEGIVAECGGGLACATCQCIVDGQWIARVEPGSEAEQQMLQFVDDDNHVESHATGQRRLSCQIAVSDALDGLVVHLPESQF